MELLNLINNSSIENIPLLVLEEKLKRINMTSQCCVVISHNDRLKSINCIREYYLDPSSKRKMAQVNMVNPCSAIHRIFKVNNCGSLDCKTCHLKMIEKYFNGEAFLIKKKKK